MKKPKRNVIAWSVYSPVTNEYFREDGIESDSVIDCLFPKKSDAKYFIEEGFDENDAKELELVVVKVQLETSISK